jgi:putative hydrolase of the HAD superfamily
MTAALLDSLHFDPYPDAVGALRWARSLGARVLVVSNWDCSLHDVLRRTGLAGALDGVLTSAEVGSRKPDAGIFAAALALCGCAAGEALHVGDSLEEDIAGARAAGIACVLVHRGGSAPPPAAPSVATLDELPLLISPA